MQLLRSLLGIAALALGVALLSVPITFLLRPLWSWVEAATGIESIGHSAPAEWCFLLVLAVLGTVAAAVLVFRRKRGRSAQAS